MGLANHSLALKSTGEVWVWGSNYYGQLGTNNPTSYSSPVLVVGSHSFVEINAGSYHSLARKSNGEVWGWGWNTYGQLGISSAGNRSSPVLVVGNHVFAGLKEYTPPSPPVLTAAVGATVDSPFDITFVDDAVWRTSIISITVNGITLVSGYTISSGAIIFTPSASNPTGLLQASGTKTIVVTVSGGYEPLTSSVSQTIGVGVTAKLGIKTQPTAPLTNGGLLSTQPAVYIQDQYGNTVTTSTANVVAAVSGGTWTLGGTKTVAGISGVTTYSDLTGTRVGVYTATGSTISFTSGALTPIISNSFNILGQEVVSSEFEILPQPVSKTLNGVSVGNIKQMNGVSTNAVFKFNNETI